MPLIPPSIIGTASPILGERYTHTELNSLFEANSFPGEPPSGNKVEKCRAWLRAANNHFEDPLMQFGRLIAEMMDEERSASPRMPWDTSDNPPSEDPRAKLHAALSREGLKYLRGGYIHGAILTGPTKSLAQRLAADSMATVEDEFERAYRTIESDPPAALTAACAILEAVCKHYCEREGVTLPNKQTLGPLWSEVAKHLGLSPSQQADDDLKQILSGLFSIANGVSALRTHEGSAHGRGSRLYRVEARHARLAVHSAHTMATFVIETWDARKRK